MRVVHKYDAGPMVGVYAARVRRGITMDVSIQRGRFTVWRLVEDAEPEYTVHFLVVGTGAEVPYDCIPVGTVHEQDGHVWHVFERKVE